MLKETGQQSVFLEDSLVASLGDWRIFHFLLHSYDFFQTSKCVNNQKTPKPLEWSPAKLIESPKAAPILYIYAWRERDLENCHLILHFKVVTNVVHCFLLGKGKKWEYCLIGCSFLIGAILLHQTRVEYFELSPILTLLPLPHIIHARILVAAFTECLVPGTFQPFTHMCGTQKKECPR